MFNITESTIRLFSFAGGMLFFFVLELIVPYRPGTVSKLRRWLNNLSMTLFNSFVLNLLFASTVIATVTYVQEKKVGILNHIAAPEWAKIVIALAFMDFMLYVWHLLNHEVPFLWRFHRVHHSDLNMDVSTATRFHIGELSVSAVIKISLIYFIGASLLMVLIFEAAVVLCAQFHHSSLKVPPWLESIYWILFVPPSMHRIHHSVIIKERNSNYGTIFSLWDRFLGTLITGIDQTRIKIGMGAYRNPSKLNLHQLLVMPFTRAVR